MCGQLTGNTVELVTGHSEERSIGPAAAGPNTAWMCGVWKGVTVMGEVRKVVGRVKRD